ncbi:MAG TPA: hypothetical protein VGP33_02035 [Chloroflexota bacterium]|nr:hypothetical protein [Chloroflexota bacterium]
MKREGPDPASSQRVRHPHEPRWPASLAVLVALVLYVTLPNRLTVGPTWLFPLLTILLLAPLSFVAPHRHGQEPSWQRAVAIGLIALINAANVASLVLLIYALLHGTKAEGRQLLVAAVELWLTNVIVFALWYWEMDRGGPGARLRPSAAQDDPSFLFPQMQNAALSSTAKSGVWRPAFIDYLYVAFTNATAFSPTDTMPLTPWAKMLMLVQSLASLLIVALVAARAVNILS